MKKASLLIFCLVITLIGVPLAQPAAAAEDSCGADPTPPCFSHYSDYPTVWRQGVFYVLNSAIPFGDATDRPLVGKLQTENQTSFVVFRNGVWFVADGNSSKTAFSFAYGDPDDIPVVGDWAGTGGVVTLSTQGPGVFRNGVWYLRNSATSGVADAVVQYGDPGDIPVVGDWNGDGTDTIGVVRGNTWYLKNSNTSGVADIVMTFGDPGDVPVVGDWDFQNDTLTPGMFRGNTWFVRNSTTSGVADNSFVLGNQGDTPMVSQTQV